VNVCVCMFQYNYLSVNGIVSFPSITWLHKYKEKYKQGEMWHSAQKAEISEEKWIYVCMFQPGHTMPCNGYMTHIHRTNNEEMLIARQRFHNHGYIDGNNWSRDKYIPGQCPHMCIFPFSTTESRMTWLMEESTTKYAYLVTDFTVPT
jgi:hypothetical protein